MMNQKEELYWASQRLFTYTDPSGVRFNIILGSGVTINNNGWGPTYLPLRVTLELRDDRVNSKKKVKIEMTYLELESFLNQNIKMFSQGRQQAYTMASAVVINRFYYNNKKTFTCNVIKLEDFAVSLKITDPTSEIGEGVVHMDFNSYQNMCNLLGGIKKRYVDISTMNVIALNQERLITELGKFSDSIRNSFNSNSDAFADFSRKIGMMLGQSAPRNEDAPTPIDVEDTTDIMETTDYIQDDFNTEYEKTSGFDNIVLDLPQDGEYQYSPTLKEDYPSPFIQGVLSNDLIRLKSWVAAFIGGDNLKPMDSFMDISMLPAEEKESIQISLNYNEIQNILTQFTKKTVKGVLQGDISEYPTDYPIIGFGVGIEKGTKLYIMCQEMLIVLLSYNLLIRNCLEHFKGNQEQIEKIGEYKRVYFVFKVLVSSFISSLNISNFDDFEKEMGDILKKVINNQVFKTLSDDYSVITMGGSYNINPEIFDPVLKKFLFLIRKMPIVSPDRLEETYEKFGVDISNDETKLDEKVVEEVEGNEPPFEPDDSHLSSFKELISIFNENGEEQPPLWVLSLSTYGELTEALRKESAPEYYYKIKRVMDMYPDITNVIELKNLISSFEEDSDVTQSRVVQEDQPNQNIEEDFDTDALLQF